MFPYTFVILSILLGAIWLYIHGRSSNGRKLPPGPPPLPIIGNLHMLGTLPHRALQKLSQKYGPIMSIRLGSIPAIVISSPEAAQLFLKTHDTVFTSRPKFQGTEYLSYGTKGMAFSENSPYWRSMRKLCTMELLSAAKVDSYADMRKEEIARAVATIRAAPPGEAVDISEVVQRLIEDMTYLMVFGRRSDHSVDLRDTIHEAVELIGVFNLSDYVPVLAPYDLQGFTRRMKGVSKTIDKIFERIIHDHEEEARVNQTPQRDFVHVLLSYMNKSSDNKFSSASDELSYSIDRDNVKAILLDMVVGALDTSSTAIEWIMTELLRHPRVMKKVQDEINSIVGEDRMVDENDLRKFKYLDMVIKETIRLHPIAPLLVPRESVEDIIINDYLIPKKSRLFVNVWAIGRDANVWSENVEEFLPERFVDSDTDVQGHHFELIPFGTGRRGCLGMNLAMTIIRLVSSQLIHCFKWELPNGVSPNELDMTERFGLALLRTTHLLAVPTYRLHI